MHVFLNSGKQLSEWSADLYPGSTLAVDCEFVRERTFWPQLGLIQLAANGRIALLDPLQLDDSEALRALFARCSRILMHAPGEDLECFLHHYGWAPQPLFDTQLAAAFVGRGVGLGYRALVEQIIGVEVDKGETRSDWLRRPLSDAQLRYSAVDVEHLHRLAEVLAAELEAQGKTAWFEDDCRAAVAKAIAQQTAPDGALDGKQISRLTDAGAWRLQRILLWRERVARERDRPRSWLLDNETCQRLAALPAGDRRAHDAALAGAQRAAGFAASELWDVLESPPDPGLPPLPPRPQQPDSRYRALFAALQADVAEVARQHALPASLLFPRRMIETLIDTGQWPEPQPGWRASLLRETLLRTLASRG